MRTFLGLLILGAVAGSMPADAQPYAGYCSATTYSGRWSMWFGDGDISAACAIVENSLLYEGQVPTSRRVGYYSLYGWNRVWVRCSNYSGSFSGYGAEPAQRALNAARWAGGQHCLFSARSLN